MAQPCLRIFIGLIAGLITTIAVANGKPVALDSVAVIVNSSVITQNQINKQVSTLKQQLQRMHQPIPADKILREQVINHLIDKELQLDLAKNLQIQITDQQLDEAINNIAKKMVLL